MKQGAAENTGHAHGVGGGGIHAMRQQLEAAWDECTCAGAARKASDFLSYCISPKPPVPHPHARGAAGAPHVAVQ